MLQRPTCGIPTLLLFLTTLAVPNAGATETPTVEEVAERARKSVVVITQMGRDGNREGVGTGFIIDPEGLIATNLHVIGEGRGIRIRLADGKSHEVEAIHASDRQQDLAILRVRATELPSLSIGDPQTLRPGAQVVAVGNPHGLAHSVVSGTVSARREIDGRDMIQVAIPIEPGNSGGPLLDLQGKVHGILTMKSLVTDNLGFAIPIDALEPLMDKPNPVPMERWLLLGALNPRDWTSLFGASWRQRTGRITAEGLGSGFGGRSLCLWQRELPGPSFELGVLVKLDDEAGAAGLVFCSDGDQRHYGFYPSGGRLRLSRFDGPDVNSWTVLYEVDTESYRPGEWNHLKVHFTPEKMECSVNGEVVIESTDRVLTSGKVGLAKFRNTHAEFKQFEVEEKIQSTTASPEALALVDKLLAGTDELATDAIDGLEQQGADGVRALRQRADELQRQVKLLRENARRVHEAQVETALRQHIRADDVDLLRGALLIAKLDDEDLNIDDYVRQVDEMAAEIAQGLDKDADDRTRLAALDRYLFEEMGFHGSRGDYYNRANSYVSQVLEDREGLPITLCVLYIELARRLGVQVVGIGLPGHFVARHLSDEDEVQMIDVFERGVRLTLEEANDRVLATTGLPITEEMLTPMTPRAILSRMVQNLFGIAQRNADSAAMLRYLGATIALDPDNAQAHLMRGVLLVQTNRKGDALDDLNWILENEPEGIDLEKVHQFRAMILRQ